jgi:hypothetical protein
MRLAAFVNVTESVSLLFLHFHNLKAFVVFPLPRLPADRQHTNDQMMLTGYGHQLLNGPNLKRMPLGHGGIRGHTNSH